MHMGIQFVKKTKLKIPVISFDVEPSKKLLACGTLNGLLLLYSLEQIENNNSRCVEEKKQENAMISSLDASNLVQHLIT